VYQILPSQCWKYLEVSRLGRLGSSGQRVLQLFRAGLFFCDFDISRPGFLISQSANMAAKTISAAYCFSFLPIDSGSSSEAPYPLLSSNLPRQLFCTLV